jgi:hypothetical protein
MVLEEETFLDYCRQLASDLESGKSLQPSKKLPGGRAVSSGESIDILHMDPSRRDFDRRESEKHLRYIETESAKFPKIAARYPFYLNEAVRQYKSFMG